MRWTEAKPKSCGTFEELVEQVRADLLKFVANEDSIPIGLLYGVLMPDDEHVMWSFCYSFSDELKQTATPTLLRDLATFICREADKLEKGIKEVGA